MKEASSIASDLKAFVSVTKTRRTKLFAYGFVLAFVAYTGFLAFNPSNNSSSPWFSNLFSTSSATSFKASIAPYRSQVSSFFSHLFPNSTEASLGDLAGGSSKGPILGAFKENGTRVGVDSAKDGVLVKNQTERSVGIKKDAGGGVAEEKQVKNGVEGKQDPSLEAKNRTGTGVSEEKQVKNGVGSDKIGAASEKAGILGVKNQTKSKVSDEKQVNSAADSDKNGVGVKKDASLGATNPIGSGVSEAEQVKNASASDKNGVVAKKDENLEAKNQTSAIGVSGDRETTSKANSTQTATKVIGEGAKVSNFTSPLAKGNSSTKAISNGGGRKKEKWIEDMIGCDIFHGHWVKDDSYPLYPEGSCPHIDEPFNCYLNGRPDRSYQRFRWQPSGCNIPRLNATDMLERLRGKRLVFVGDSLNRNMWESLVCILRNSVKDKKKVFEASGKHEFRTEGSYSFLFKDYKATVEFFRSPFLVQEWEVPAGNGTKETLRLDIIERSSSKYKDAHVIIFNTGHWWTHEKTSKGKDYYQEGNRVYGELNVVEAFHKALNTWAKWVDTNVNPKKTLVFFRGYSASHFSGGQWNSGGACDRETEPIKNEKYLSSYPPKMRVLESVIKGMKTPVNYLNITRITDFRKDAHPSVYRKQNLTEEEKRDPLRFQDCSHWCLPGVPDTWNELVYAQLIIKQYQMGL